jgi:hypothetical protein
MVEIVFGQASLHEGSGVDAGRSMALDVDVVTWCAGFFAPPEVVEPNVVQRGGTGKSGEVAADSVGMCVGSRDHGDRVPADVGPDPVLHVGIAGEPWLGLRWDGVEVRGRDRCREVDLEVLRSQHQLADEELAPPFSMPFNNRGIGLNPLLGFRWINIRQSLEEAVKQHGSILAGWCGLSPQLD